VEHNILFTLPVQGKCSAGVSDSDSTLTGMDLILSPTTTRDDKEDDDDNNDEKKKQVKSTETKNTMMDQQKKRSTQDQLRETHVRACILYVQTISCTTFGFACRTSSFVFARSSSILELHALVLSNSTQATPSFAVRLRRTRELEPAAVCFVTHIPACNTWRPCCPCLSKTVALSRKEKVGRKATSAYFKLNVAFQIASWRKTPQMWCSGPRGPKARLDCSAASIISTSPLLSSRTTPRRYHDLPAAVRPAAKQRSCPWFLCRIIGDIRLG
jgi:hypothetical protein